MRPQAGQAFRGAIRFGNRVAALGAIFVHDWIGSARPQCSNMCPDTRGKTGFR